MKNFIKLFLLNEENAAKSTISPEIENTILGHLLSNTSQTGAVASVTMSPRQQSKKACLSCADATSE